MNKYCKSLLFIPFFLFSISLFSQTNGTIKAKDSKKNKTEYKLQPLTKESINTSKYKKKGALLQGSAAPKKEKPVDPERKFARATKKKPAVVHYKTTKQDLQRDIKSLEKKIANLQQSTDTDKTAKLEKLYKVLEKKKQNLLSKG